MRMIFLVTGTAVLIMAADFTKLKDIPPDRGGPPPVTITGEVVDLECYIPSGLRGQDHAGCARTCIKNGTPIGIVTVEGTIYIASLHDGSAMRELLPFVAQMVRVRGQSFERGGVRLIKIESVEAIKSK